VAILLADFFNLPVAVLHADYQTAVPRIPSTDRKNEINNNIRKNKDTHPPSPKESQTTLDKSKLVCDSKPKPPCEKMNREEIRFLADVAARSLSTTVSRYQRLNLSRRRGNAIRQHLTSAGIVEAVTIATRSGQVVLYRLTDFGRSVCSSAGIYPEPRARESLEHSFWVNRAARYFEKKSYDVACEHPVKGNGAIDILAQRPGERIAVEVETGKSNVKTNLNKVRNAGFDQIVLVATSPAAVSACQKAIDSVERDGSFRIEQLTWLDIS